MDTKSLPSGNFPVDTKSSDPFKIIIKEEDDDVSLPGSRLHQTNNEGFIELRQRLEKMRTDPFSSFVRVDGGTVSGCWEATGVDMVYSINVKTVNRWWETYTSILDPMDNHQQQQYELPTNVGPENRNEYGYNSSCGEASTRRHYPYVPLVHLDILSGKDQIDVEKGHNSHTDLASYRAWNDYRNQLKNSKFDDDAMKMMSGIFIAVAGQVVAGMMVNRLTRFFFFLLFVGWARCGACDCVGPLRHTCGHQPAFKESTSVDSDDQDWGRNNSMGHYLLHGIALPTGDGLDYWASGLSDHGTCGCIGLINVTFWSSPLSF